MSCKGKLSAPQTLGMAMLRQYLIFLSGHLDLEISFTKKNKTKTGSDVKLSAYLSFLPVYTMEGITSHDSQWQSMMAIFAEDLIGINQTLKAQNTVSK